MTTLLTQPGHEITLTVSGVRQIESTAKPGTFRYQIDGTMPDGKIENTFLNTSVVDRELKRLRLTIEQLIGQPWRFYRVPAPNNTPASGYLNIEPAPGVRAAVPAKRLTGPASEASGPITAQSLKDDPQGTGEATGGQETEAEAIERKKHGSRQAAAKRYLALWNVVAEHQVAKGKELEMPVDGMSVNAATATLWIHFTNRGML